MEVQQYFREPRPMPPMRRLSMSSDSQWTSGGRSVGGGSGYALSPTTGTSSANASLGPASLPAPSSSLSLGLMSPHLPPVNSAHIRATRQLNAASIFERLGLTGIYDSIRDGSSNSRTVDAINGSSNSIARSSSSSSRSPTRSSPLGGEDTALPSEQFEGLSVQDEYDNNNDNSQTTIQNVDQQDNAAALALLDVTTPTGNVAEHRRTLSSGTLTGMAPVIRRGSTTARPSPIEEGSTVSSLPSSTGVAVNGNSKIIAVSEDILLPFVERPTEVQELLEHTPRNKGLWDRLREVFTPHPAPHTTTSTSSNSTTPATSGDSTPELGSSTATSSSASSSHTASSDHNKSTWQDVLTILYTPREDMSDQEWIDNLKHIIFPRSTPLWERLRACLGIDVDDERGGDKYEELSSDINNVATGVTPPLQPLFGDTGPLSSSSSTTELYSHSGGSAPSGKSPVPSLADEMLSPRAILRTQLNDSSNLSAPVSIPGAVGLRPPPHSPSFGASVSPIPSPSFGSAYSIGGGGGAARSFDRTNASGSSSDRSPEGNRTPGGTNRDASTRMHRRSSSGGSSFRRSFAMSSIDEDAPVHDFSNPHTPSEEDSPKQHMLSAAAAATSQQYQQPPHHSETVAHQHSGIAGLLRSKGAAFDSTGSQVQQPYALFGSALSTSSASTMSSSLPSGHSLSQGQALASPTMALTPSSSFGSSLGLQAELPSSMQQSPSQAGLAAIARSGPGLPISPSKRAYDEYTAVFESDDGSSVAGSVRSTGRGPGMRFSFGAAGSSAGRGVIKPASGFALAGLNVGKKSDSADSSQSNSGGNSTPRAGSMSRQ